jgi:transcriptional regulator with XRE-family HTH domain
MLSIEQCRGARGILNWTQQELADASGLSKTAINNFEKGHSDIKNESLKSIKYAFVSAGIEFIGQHGLTRRTDKTEILNGENAFLTLFNDILDSAEQTQKELMISNYNLKHVMSQLSDAKLKQRNAIFKNSMISQRFLCTPENVHEEIKGREYRALPDSITCFAPTTYIYGESKVAFGLWEMSSILIVNSKTVYDAEIARFNHIWEKASPLQPKAAA